MPCAWMPTLTGRDFLLSEPRVETSHLFTEIAPSLARIPRFIGHTFHRYSVAQHSAICAEAAEDMTGDRELAAMCLLHDAHEAYTGDITHPVEKAIVEEMSADLDPATARLVRESRAAHFERALHRIKSRIDVAVVYAAGFDEQVLMRHMQAVKEIDLRALRSERDHLMPHRSRAWQKGVDEAEPLPLRGGRFMQHQFSEYEAQARFVSLLQRLCPAARGVTA